ncbi:MAG: ParB/RepB/Spo0J family partition protein [Clostridia bacterium]|nr:ParB/RepB/Spo0J family partition protein [Clostridia bacterium]
MIKKGLGKGLSALLSVYDEEDLRVESNNKNKRGGFSEPNNIDISLIYANPNQPRRNFDETSLKELAASIKTHGIIQPIVLNRQEDGNYMIIAGERRWRAAKMIGLSDVPAVIKNYSSKQIKEISIIENLQREDLNPIEAARAIKQLMEEYELTQDVVAERIGKSRPAVTNTLRLLTLSADVIELVEKNKLSAGHARCLVVLSPLEQSRVAALTINKRLSVRDIEKLVKNLTNPSSERPKDQQSLELKDMVDEMQRIFATKVSVIGNDNKGRIYIDYYSKDDLDRISDLLSLLNKKTLTLKDLSMINKK